MSTRIQVTTVKTRMWAIAAVVAAALLVAGTSYVLNRQNAGSADGRLRIVSGTNVWANIAEQIGGRHVQVTALMSDSATDPHFYESSAANGLAVAKADLVIVNGIGYDEFLSKILAASNRQESSVLTAAAIMGHTGNPHVWYDVAGVSKVAVAIRDKLIQLDSTHKADYERQYTTLNAALTDLQADMAELKTDFAARRVLCTEPVAEYMVTALGLQNATPAGFSNAIQNGNEPNVTDRLAFTNLIAGKSAAALIYNGQAESVLTQDIRRQAEDVDLPVVVVTETLPRSTNYQDWFRLQLVALDVAMGSPRS